MGQGSEGKDYLIKNMLEDDNVGGREIETPITLMISRVSKEDTTGGLGCQFVDNLCGEVGIANTAENVEVLI
jgi:hypothetical protein